MPVDLLDLPYRDLTRNPSNPLIANGPEVYDDLKAGPRQVHKMGSTYYMLYEAIEDDASLTTTVAYATSSDGTTWTKYAGNPVMEPSEAWEGPEVAPTSWFWDSDENKYVLFYHGGGNSIQRQIGVATADALTGPWTKYASNPVLSYGSAASWEENFVADAKIIKRGTGDYVMYYYGVNDAGKGRIGRATASSIFGPWTKDAGNPVLTVGTSGAWDDDAVQSPGVFWDDELSVYHLWYVGDDGADEAIGYAYSEDGISWTKGPDNPVLSSIAGDDIGDTIDAYRDGNLFRVLYGSFDFSGDPVRAIAEATVAVATLRFPVLGFGTLPDSSGNVWFEPYPIKATNDVWRHGVFIFNDTATRIGIYGIFDVPEEYVGTPQIVVRWTSTVTSGDVEWDVDYRAVGGDDTESLDQATAQESVNQNDTAPSAAHERMVATLNLTAANLAPGDTVEFGLFRDGTDGGDTLAGAVIVHQVFFQYSDS